MKSLRTELENDVQRCNGRNGEKLQLQTLRGDMHIEVVCDAPFILEVTIWKGIYPPSTYQLHERQLVKLTAWLKRFEGVPCLECAGSGSIVIGSKNDRTKLGFVTRFLLPITTKVCPRCGGNGLLIRDGNGNYRRVEDDRS